MFADEHGCAPMREHAQDESEGSRTSGQLCASSLRGSGGDDAKGRAETALGFPPKSRSTGWGLFPPDLHVRVLEDTLNPVALPPRRAKVSTKPSLTGSGTCLTLQ